ncbi:MAG TPA: pyridoxamine 5'-phosphate oxidase family protein [Solirubrobacterales bacterium]|nr:pyridoxamine 5'-phosphate oxidase family protein [Solirubrobacterales bacterium]
MTLRELPDWALGMLEAERVARLAYLDEDDRPRVLPIVYAIADDAVWGVIDTKPKRAPEPARVRWIRRRPEVALCVDVYDDAWEHLAWVQLLGRVHLVDLAGHDKVLDALGVRYPQYRERTPPGPLLHFGVERSLWWRISDYPE